MAENTLLLNLLSAGKTLLQQLFEDELPIDLAEALAQLDEQRLVFVAENVSPESMAPVLEVMDYDFAERLLLLVPCERAALLVNEMSSDDAADLLAELPEELREQILVALNGQASPIRELLGYDEDTSGGIMATEFLAVRPEWTSEKALAVVRKTAQEADTAYYVYVTDREQHLMGVLSLRELVLAAPGATISQIMQDDPVAVRPEDDQEAVAALFRRYHLMALPVVNEDNVMKGIITSDDILNVVDDEATEDIERMAALYPSETPYLSASITKLAGQRLTWLLVLMLSATFTGQIIARFEDVLSKLVYLAVFIPMLMDSGGNAGSQSATLVIRGLALGDIQLRDWMKVMGRELQVSALVGAGLSLVNFGRVLLLERYPVPIAAVVSLTLFCTIMIAKIVGGLLPLGAKALRLDPAIMAGPLITTIVDALALIVYFSLAAAMLNV